ncbi:MAG: diacylglycerol/lipid kinase family protein [Longimicrobiales bacterium]
MISNSHSAAAESAATSARRIQVILNPTARSGAAAAMREEIARELGARGVAWTRVDTDRPGHAVEIARRAALDGARVVVAVGGDGTAHEVANGLLRARAEREHETALGIIPCGTGNDFAHIVAGIRSRDAAYDALLHGHTRRVDAGFVQWDGGDEYFVNAMGTGMDVEVVRQLRKTSRLPGALIYLSAVLRTLRSFRPAPLRLASHDTVVDSRAYVVAICNGSRIAGGLRVCPDSLPDDGALDACFVQDLAWHQIPATLAGVVRGTHVHRPRVRMVRAPAFTLGVPAGTQLFFQVDGELRDAGGAHELRVSAVPGALRVVSAPANVG